MQTIAMAMQKGGAGKTTSVVNLSAALAKLGRKVLVIDYDIQGDSSHWLLGPVEERGEGASKNPGADLMQALLSKSGFADLVVSSEWGVDVIANDDGSAGLDLKADQFLLKRAIRSLPDNWDYVIIDCPPSLNLITINALVAARSVLMPVEMSEACLRGLVRLHELIDQVKEDMNEDLHVAGVFACNVETQTNNAKNVIETLKAIFSEDKLMGRFVRHTTDVANAMALRKPVVFFKPRATASQDYIILAKELDEKFFVTEQPRMVGNE